MNTIGMQVLRTTAAVASLLLAATVAAQPAMYGGSPFQNAFYNINVDTADTLSTVAVTGTSGTVTGINGVTVDPGTGTIYAIVKVSGVSGRVLVTIDPATGVAAEVGNLGDNFSSIAFRDDGQLFGVTGDGATVPETLFLIDKSTAATSVATALGNGADGEIIAFNPEDGFFYHWSGNGTVVFERIMGTAPYTVTNIPLIGATNGEPFGAAWDACRGVFVVSNIGSRLQTYAPDGTVGAQYGASLLDDVRGLALLPPDNCDVDLAVSVAVAPPVVAPGSPVTFTFDITNLGPARALDPVLTLTSSANVTGATTSGCVEDPAGFPICTLPATLFQGETAQVVVSGTYTGGTATLVASASSGSDETAPPDNTVTGVVGPVFNVTPTSGLVTTEAGGTDTFDVVLNAQPSSDVTVPVSSSNPAEATVSTALLTFTTANWNVPQTVTLSGVDDAVADGNVGYDAVLGASSSADAGFDGVDAPDVAATNLDDDIAGIEVAPVSGLVTTEAGGSAQFTVVLTSQPAADVTIPVSTSDAGEGTVSAALLTFTPGNWNVTQAVTVTGVDDAAADGDIAYTIVLGAAGSTDAGYAGVDPSDVAVTNLDDDVAAATVAPTAGLLTTEAGGSAQFTVVLNTQPSADVAIPVASSDPTEGSVSTPSLVFTPANWNTAQTVTVTGVDDAVVDGSIAYSVVLGGATSADAGYAGVDPADVAVSNSDNDTAGVSVTPTGGLVTTEAGGTASFTVVLGAAPTADVTIPVSSSDTTEGTVSPAFLSFTPANWNVPQQVTVTGVADDVDDGDVAYTVVLGPAASADPAFAGLDPADVSVVNNGVASAPAGPAGPVLVPGPGPVALLLGALAMLLAGGLSTRRRTD